MRCWGIKQKSNNLSEDPDWDIDSHSIITSSWCMNAIIGFIIMVQTD